MRWIQPLIREWPWLLAVGVAAWLRGFGLLEQVPVDDEWHAIHGLLLLDYGQIARSLGPVDRCIPLTLYLKLAADTVGLTDWVLRLPSFLAGCLTVVVCPWLARRHLDRQGRQLFAWLLALSPLLVFYSRTLRPYDFGVLLSFCCLHLAERWWRTGASRYAVGYGACGALALWFLLAVAPFVLAPLLGMAAACTAQPRSALRRVGPPGLALLAFAAPLLGPPLATFPEALFGKLGAARPELDTVATAFGFLLGTREPWIAALMLVLGVVGARLLWRRARIWTAFALAACAVLAASALASTPRYAWLGFVLGRYWLPVLPVLWVFVAAAVAATGGRQRYLPGVAGTALCALLLWTGGLPALLLDGSAWLAPRWVTQMEGEGPAARRVPDFYRRLANEPPGSMTLVESPWHYSMWNGLLQVYQRVHGQRVLVGMTTGLCTRGHWGEYPSDAGIELRSFVPLAEPEALRERGVRYVVFHRDLESELAHPVDPIDLRATGQPDMGGCIAAYRRLGWPEVFRDAAIVAFAVPQADDPAAGISPAGS